MCSTSFPHKEITSYLTWQQIIYFICVHINLVHLDQTNAFKMVQHFATKCVNIISILFGRTHLYIKVQFLFAKSVKHFNDKLVQHISTRKVQLWNNQKCTDYLFRKSALFCRNGHKYSVLFWCLPNSEQGYDNHGQDLPHSKVALLWKYPMRMRSDSSKIAMTPKL